MYQKKPESYSTVMVHVKRSKDIFHEAVSKYVSHCAEHLPAVTNLELQDMGDANQSHYKINDTTYQKTDPYKDLRPIGIYKDIHGNKLEYATDEVSVDYGCSDDDSSSTSDSES